MSAQRSRKNFFGKSPPKLWTSESADYSWRYFGKSEREFSIKKALIKRERERISQAEQSDISASNQCK